MLRMLTLLLLLFSLESGAFAAAPLAGIASLEIKNQRPLIFTSLVQNHPTETITISANDNNSADFSATGPQRANATAKLLTKTVLLTAPRSHAVLKAKLFTFGGNANKRGKFRFPPGEKNTVTTIDNLLVGSSITVNSDTPAGTYQGQGILQIRTKKKPRLTSNQTFLIKLAIMPDAQITNLRPMVFPSQMAHFQGSDTLNPNDNGSAEFVASGKPSSAAQVQVSPTTVLLHRLATNQTIKVDHFSYGSTSGQINPTTGEFRFPSSSNDMSLCTLFVGAVAHYTGNLPAGTYTGNAILRIIYK